MFFRTGRATNVLQHGGCTLGLTFGQLKEQRIGNVVGIGYSGTKPNIALQKTSPYLEQPQALVW